MDRATGSERKAEPPTRARRALPLLSPGWRVVIGSALCNMVCAGLSFSALGIYVQPLEREFGWSRAELSAAVSIMFLVGGLTGPLVGLVIDRWGPRRPIILSAIGLGLTYLVLARIAALWQLYALYAVMSFIRAWVNYIPFLWLISRWFPDRMGAPVGVMGVGFSASGLVFVPLVTWLVAALGWRQSFVISAFILVATIIPLTLLVLKEPPHAAATAGAPARRPPPGSGLTLRQALRTRAFWLLSLALSLFFMGLVSFQFHAIPLFLSRGFSDQEAAGWVSAIAAAGTAGRLGLGYLVDRIPDLRKFAMLAGIAPALALGLLAFSDRPAALLAFVGLWSVGTAVGPLMESVMLARIFGTASFGAILGAIGVAETAGTIIGPVVGGVVYDATDSYTIALVFYAAGFLLTALAFSMLDGRSALPSAPS